MVVFWQVKSGLDALLFNLLILGVLKSSSGQVWRRRVSDLYMIELTTGPKQGVNETVQRRPVLSKVSFIESFKPSSEPPKRYCGSICLISREKKPINEERFLYCYWTDFKTFWAIRYIALMSRLPICSYLLNISFWWWIMPRRARLFG